MKAIRKTGSAAHSGYGSTTQFIDQTGNVVARYWINEAAIKSSHSSLTMSEFEELAREFYKVSKKFPKINKFKGEISPPVLLTGEEIETIKAFAGNIRGWQEAINK